MENSVERTTGSKRTWRQPERPELLQLPGTKKAARSTHISHSISLKHHVRLSIHCNTLQSTVAKPDLIPPTHHVLTCIFFLSFPGYINDGHASLKHQRAPDDDRFKDEWYQRGQRAGPAATKYRKGACENCGAMTHKTKECVERPRKKGAKWTGKNIKEDEVIQDVAMTFDAKRDRWNGYDTTEHSKIYDEYEKVEEARRKLKESELDKQDARAAAMASRMENNANEFGDSDDDDDDEEKYADKSDMPGQKVNAKTRTTIRNLR